MVVINREKLLASDIFRLIKSLDDGFAKRLSEKIDLFEYSKKLEAYADFITAKCENDIVGLIAYYTNNESHEYYIPYVCVCVNHRRMGIADALLTEICKIAEEKEFVVALEVRKVNNGAISLYEKYGFCIVGSNDSKYLMNRVNERA